MDNYEALTSTNGREPRHLEHHRRNLNPRGIEGNHTLKFGAEPAVPAQRHVPRTPASFFGGTANGSWVTASVAATCPAASAPAPTMLGAPRGRGAGHGSYADSFINMLGRWPQTTARYNYTVDGGVISEGTPLPRLYVSNEYGLRPGSVARQRQLHPHRRPPLQPVPPVYEGRGQQVVDADMGDWVAQRQANWRPASPASRDALISFVPAARSTTVRIGTSTTTTSRRASASRGH